MARPKKDPDKAKSTYFRFRCTEDERKLIASAAATKSLDSSAWARMTLLDVATKTLRQKT
jgi:uncharacterized protein (DUF1778 family)